MTDVRVRFGNKLRDTRLEKEPSQEKLADLAGLHRTCVHSVELGKRNVSLINVERLAIGLGVSMAELMPSKERGTSNHQL